MAVKAKQQYYADETTIKKEAREFGMIDELKDKLDSIEYGAQVNIIEEVQENGVPLEIVDKSVNVLVPEVIDNLYTIDPNNSLSAKQGKILYDMIKNLLARGRFLSTWNTATGLPVTNPEESPYEYKAGDYYIVGIVAAEGGTNFRPEPGEYVINVASDEQETSEVHVSDIYVYDGENWVLLINSTRELAVDDYVDYTYQSTNPVENQAIAKEFVKKQNKFYTVSTTQPSNPVEGDEWYDATNDKVFYWDGTQWKEMGGGSTYTAGLHISIDPNDNNKISVVEWSATSSALGLVKLGSDTPQNVAPNNVSSKSNRTYRIQANNSGQLMVNVPWEDTTYISGTGISISNNRVISCTVKPVTVGPTAPSTPGTGDLWYDTNKNTMFLYKNNSWTIIGPEIYPITKADYDALTPAEQGDGRFFLITDNDGTIYVDWDNVQNRPMYIGATAPSNPCEGYIWYDTTNDVLKVYDGTQWNEVGGGGGCCYTAGNGIDITNDEISIDTTVVATKTDLNSKQDVFHTTSSTAPSNPNEGDEWYDTTNDVLKVYDGTNWIVTGKTYTAGNGIGIDSNNEISVDASDLAGTGLSTDNNNNLIVDTTTIQEKLVSGTNIKTVNNNSLLGSGNINIPSGKNDIITSVTAPVDTTVLWIKDNSGTSGTNELYYYDNKEGEWVAFNGVYEGDTAPSYFNLWYDTNDYTLKVNDARTSNQFSPICLISYGSSSAPGATLWYYRDDDTGDSRLKYYDEDTSEWQDIRGPYINSSAPYDTDFGEMGGLWVDTSGTYPVIKYYDAENTTWKPIGGVIYTAGDGIDISNDEISIDTTVVATKTDLSSKQDTISDLATIRSGASAGATAVQPNDNVSALTNDAGYITNSALNGYATESYVDTGLANKADITDVNTKVFSLSGTSDLTTAQAAYDWYLDGKTPIIRYYNQYYYLRNIYSSNIRFYRIWEGIFNVNATSGFQDNGAIVFNISNNNVTSISATSTGTSFTTVDGKQIADNGYLRVDYNYSNPYIPRYDGSPATKKYVDDGLADKADTEDIPTKTSDLTNDSGFITNAVNDLVNYYTKTETYTKTEVDNLISSFGNFEVVASLPSVSTASEKTIYLLGPIGTGADKYEEWIVTETEGVKSWTKIGETSMDLSNYVTSTQLATTLQDYATTTQLATKQDTLVSGTNIKTINNESLLGSGNITISAPTYTAGDGIDITDNEISVNTDVIQEKLTAGDGITIENVCTDISDMQGPAPDGFHVPLNTEWQAMYDIWTALGGGSSDGTNFGIALKLPLAGDRFRGSSSVSDQGAYGRYRSSTRTNASNAYSIHFDSSVISPQTASQRSNGLSVRCFKNSPIVPTPSWTKLYGMSIESGGIFWSSTDGLISLSSNGQTWVTIMDKNLGATTVWNSGDTLSEANCGKYYQRGNNYGFPRTGTVTTSSTQVDASAYGPGNYYSSSTFITRSSSPYRWDTTDNANLRGGVSQGSSQECALTISADTTVLATQTDLSGKQDKATSGSTAPSTTPTYVGQQYIDTTNDKMYVATGTSSSSDWTEVGSGAGDMLYADYGWATLTGASVTLTLRGEITPSANFTVNKPNDLKDGQFYVLRVDNGATAYTMTLGTGVTNPYSEDLTLVANNIQQFMFLAKGGNLELQPSTEIDISGKQDKATSGSTAPSTTPSYVGQQYVDTTNNILYVAKGTSSSSDWIVAGKTYTAGDGIDIDANNEISVDTDVIQEKLTAGTGISIAGGTVCTTESDRKGPAPSGFHVPSTTEWQGVRNIIANLGLTTGDGRKINLHMPFAGQRASYSADISSQGSVGNYWSSSPCDSSHPYSARDLNLTSFSASVDSFSTRTNGYSVRAFKNSYVAPDSSWTVIQGTLGSSGIFWNQSEGLISITDGTIGYTIMDKNLGATTVYNDGDTLSQANMGNMYQWGNNYGFPSTGTISKTSSTLVDASGYGPGNYYESDTFITGSNDWSSVYNDDLWGDTSNSTHQECVESPLTISADIVSGSGAPATTPSYIGQQYVDTTNDKLYVATGTTSSSDWIEVGSNSGGGNVIAMTQSEYNALTTEEKNDGKLRIITDAPTEDISVDWANIANKPIELSTQSGNTLTSLKIWVGRQTDYEALATKDASTLYFTTNVVS